MFLIPQFSQNIILILPILRHFDPEVQEDRGADEVLDFISCILAGFFEDAAFVADDDALLGVSFHENGAANVDLAIFSFVEFLGEYADGVRHFFAGAKEELFADDFLDNISFRLVSHHVVREILRPFRQVLGHHLHQGIQIIPGLGRQRYDFCKFVNLAVLHQFLQELFFGNQVGLREGQDHRHLSILQEGNDVSIPGAQGVVAGAKKYDEIHFVQSVHGVLADHFAQLALGFVHPWGVQENHLGIVAVPHAGDFISCRLGVMGYDGNLLPQKGIHQRGLPHIRTAHQGYKAGMKFIFFVHKVSYGIRCKNAIDLVVGGR